MRNLPLKIARYLRCYKDLAWNGRPETVDGIVDYCVNRPVLIGQVRSEIIELGKILTAFQPRSVLEIGTNYGGTLLLWCTVSAPDAKIISVDLPRGPFGGGYPRRKMPLFRAFTRGGQQLYLLRGDSHSVETKARILSILDSDRLDYLFIDADHTYAGVRRDFEMYSPLLRSGGIAAFHDIVTYAQTKSEVRRFWNEIKQNYRHQELVEQRNPGPPPVAVTGASMETAGLGLLFMP
jgi:cephalosporin hydroxylase